ncbi:MAG: hypothetical protein ACE5F1_06160 [Planctomycetota bacterium]
MHYRQLPGDTARARAFDWGELRGGLRRPPGLASPGRVLPALLATSLIALVAVSLHGRAGPRPGSPGKRFAIQSDAELWSSRLDLTHLALAGEHSPYLEIALRRLISLSLKRGGGQVADAMLGTGIYLLELWRRRNRVSDQPPVPPATFPAARAISAALRNGEKNRLTR